MKTNPTNPHDGPQPPSAPRIRARRRAASFIFGKRGAAMTLTLSLLILLLSGVGSLMANYAWQEAQWEEFRAAQRAAIAALGTLVGADTPADQQKAQQIVQKVLAALQPGVTPGTVTITQDLGGTTTVTFGGGTITLTDLWGGDSSTVSLPDSEVVVKLDSERYEVALAVDVTTSMDTKFTVMAPHGSPTKMESLKSALTEVANAMRATNDATPGSVMASVVPFASLVNVADTASGLPLVNSGAPPGRTAAKERYVRMLAGALSSGNPIDIGSSTTLGSTLYRANLAAQRGYGQWVDTFHRYGEGEDLGPLRSQGLPTDLLQNRDWNLRRNQVTIDIAAQRPARPDWVVDDIDFWNGCLMARWGAHWADLGAIGGNRFWPRTMDAPKWSPKAAELKNAPLHLSDVPPDEANPHTLFTAYSWPDASISAIDPGPGKNDVNVGPGSADHWLQAVMARMLNPLGASQRLPVESFGMRRFNDWTANSISGAVVGGNAMCPEAPILPLTDDPDLVQAFALSVASVKRGVSGHGYFSSQSYPHAGYVATYIVRGVVWALRTISPLWQSVWRIQDRNSRPRPTVTCAAGETVACDTRARKSMILVSDGGNTTGFVVPSSSTTSRAARRGYNPGMYFNQHLICDGSRPIGGLKEYSKAWALEHEANFNESFRAAGVRLDPDCSWNPRKCQFNPNPNDPSDRALAAFEAYEHQYPSLAMDSTRRDARAQALRQFTPWEFFRPPELGRTGPTAADAIMDPANKFVDLTPYAPRGFGRPVQLGSWCKPQIPFGPYGGFDETVLTGKDGDGTRRPPAEGQAPFAYSILDNFPAVDGHVDLRRERARVHQALIAKLGGWMREACRLVGQRGVTLYAIHLGADTDTVDHLRTCVVAAGGDADARLFVTPNSGVLEQTLLDLFSVRHTLTFI